jgi:DNA-binding MarR family transcriptional regulator
MTQAKRSFEFEGEKALETAKTVLSNYEIEGQVERISVELEESYKGEGADKGNGQTDSDSDSEDRELKEIQAGTNHHIVLTAIKELQGKGETPASGREIYEYLDDIKEGSVYAALSHLYKRMLVNREKVKEDGNRKSFYEMSGHGDEELKRLGMYE